MRRTLTCFAFTVATCAVAFAQVVQVKPHDNATDIWGPYFNARKKITFTGYIKGIVKGKPAARADVQYALIVKNSNGGDLKEVEVGPNWFVKDQQAKLHVGDRVHVTGTKLTIDHHDVIVASQVLLRDQGGPVLALRRPNGRAYWMPAVIAEEPAQVAVAQKPPEVSLAETPSAGYPPTMLELNGGQLNVDNRVWYGYQNAVTRIGSGVNVISGPYPFLVW